jgi:hypothetical protein
VPDDRIIQQRPMGKPLPARDPGDRSFAGAAAVAVAAARNGADSRSLAVD